MNEAFFHIILENKATNYCFMCGGTAKEIIKHMRAEDTNRNDGNLIAPEMEQVLAQFGDKNKGQFFIKPYENGLVTQLIEDGYKATYC